MEVKAGTLKVHIYLNFAQNRWLDVHTFDPSLRFEGGKGEDDGKYTQDGLDMDDVLVGDNGEHEVNMNKEQKGKGCTMQSRSREWVLKQIAENEEIDESEDEAEEGQ